MYELQSGITCLSCPQKDESIRRLASDVARLTAEFAAATRPYLILDDPEGIIGCVEAVSPEAAWEAFKAANPNDYDGDPADCDVMIRRITAELYDSVVDDLEVARSDIYKIDERHTLELAAAPGSARRWSAIRAAVATVQAATGLGGDTPLDDDAVAELLSGALQNASRAHYAETALRTDAEATARTLEHHRRLFVGQQARAERAESELAAAQAERDRLQAMAPRLVWYVGEEGFTLSLCIDQLVQVLWKWLPAEGLDRATKIRSIQTWCAATIPSIPLPDFPGAL